MKTELLNPSTVSNELPLFEINSVGKAESSVMMGKYEQMLL